MTDFRDFLVELSKCPLMWRDKRFGSIIAKLAIRTAQTTGASTSASSPSSVPLGEDFDNWAIEYVNTNEAFQKHLQRTKIGNIILRLYNMKHGGQQLNTPAEMLHTLLRGAMAEDTSERRQTLYEHMGLSTLAYLANHSDVPILRPIKSVLAPLFSANPRDAKPLATINKMVRQYYDGMDDDEKRLIQKEVYGALDEVNDILLKARAGTPPEKPSSKPGLTPPDPSSRTSIPKFSAEVEDAFLKGKTDAFEAIKGLIAKHSLDSPKAERIYDRDVATIERGIKEYLQRSGVNTATVSYWSNIVSHMILASFLIRTNLATKQEATNFRRIVDTLNKGAPNWERIPVLAHLRRGLPSGEYGYAHLDKATAGRLLVQLHTTVKDKIRSAMSAVQLSPEQRNLYNSLIGANTLADPNRVDILFQSALLSPTEVGKRTKFNTPGTHAYAIQIIDEVSKALSTSKNKEEALPRILNALIQRIESWGSFTGARNQKEISMSEPIRPPTAKDRVRFLRMAIGLSPSESASAELASSSPSESATESVPDVSRPDLPPKVVKEQLMGKRVVPASVAWLQPDVISLASIILYQLLKIYIGRPAQY